MGYQLWISPQTGIRRKGTSFKELQTLFIDQITTKFIFEPIYSCNINDNGLIVKEQLEIKDFDIVGVIDDSKNIIGYAKKEELKDRLIIDSIRNLDFDLIITDSTPISKLPSLLASRGFVFVMQVDKIVGIVTIADINKPVFRIYLFGIISLFEMHLNYWINSYYPDNTWRKLLIEQRLDEAIRIYDLRKGGNQDLSLLECLQFCDKREILKSTPEFILFFNFLENNFDKYLKIVEKIRNELAHSQNSIISNVKWNIFIEAISRIEIFLVQSEQIIEEKTRK
jgi:predicted transcriptional regulator